MSGKIFYIARDKDCKTHTVRVKGGKAKFRRYSDGNFYSQGTSVSLCYSAFTRVTGIKLRKGQQKKVKLTEVK